MANAIAQNRAAAQNEAMIDNTIEQGQRNMAFLERTVMKDNTLLPGEWYGGRVFLQPPTSVSNGPKSYVIALQVGPDRHEVVVDQMAVR
jgi:hypothetical protein